MQPRRAADRTALVATLRRELERFEGPRPLDGSEAVLTGVPALDRLLPTVGLRPGSLIEYLAATDGGGAGTLALIAATAACRDGRLFVVLDRQRRFYPAVAAAWGIDLTRTLLLRPTNQAEEQWTVDQALRCPGVGAVWVAWDRLDGRSFRRLQLAAESGGTLGLFVRPGRIRGQPSWADVQWLVEPQCFDQCWRLQVTLVRCRGSAGGGSVVLELDQQSGTWHEASEYHAAHPLPALAPLAGPTAMRRRSRA